MNGNSVHKSKRGLPFGFTFLVISFLFFFSFLFLEIGISVYEIRNSCLSILLLFPVFFFPDCCFQERRVVFRFQLFASVPRFPIFRFLQSTVPFLVNLVLYLVIGLSSVLHPIIIDRPIFVTVNYFCHVRLRSQNGWKSSQQNCSDLKR